MSVLGCASAIENDSETICCPQVYTPFIFDFSHEPVLENVAMISTFATTMVSSYL